MPPKPAPQPDNPPPGAGAGGLFLACVLVGGALGYGFDYIMNSLPWGSLAGLGLGFAAALREIWRALNSKPSQEN